MMKVLASVYACSPYDGSERAVGWNWIKELDKYNEIIAITSHVYRRDIEDFMKKNPTVIQNTKFVYVDVPHTKWHVGYRLERLYYMLWQKEAVKKAKEICRNEKIDLVHHITYVTCVLPTYMHELEIPFLYGPVSGGENTPSVIGYPMSVKERMVEFVRSASQLFFKSTPNFLRTMKKSSLILVTTDETKKLIPACFQDKVRVFQSIGLNEEIFYPEPPKKNNAKIQFLVAGRMLYWKGFELAIRAFVKASQSNENIELTVLGDTENNASYEAHKMHLVELCGSYGDDRIKFVSTVPHNEMKNFYDKFDCLLNCSLRDSGCFVVMEGMSRELPLICVNTGGPKINTTDESAIKVEPAPMEEMVEQIANAILKIAENEALRLKMGIEARRYAKENFTISSRTNQMMRFYEEAVKKGMKKKVCMIVQNKMVKGGIAAVISGYYGSKLEQDYEIIYVESYKDGGKLTKLLKGIQGYIKFIKILLVDRPDLVHIHSSFGPSFYRKLPFIYMASWAKKPIINHIHGADFDEFYTNSSEKKKRLIKKVYGKCKILVALSEEWKQRLEKIVPKEKIMVIENYSVLHEDALKERCSRQSNHEVLFLGELGRRKGCYDIPSVIEDVAKDIPDVKFILAGAGSAQDETAIKQLIKEKGIERNVEFPGWVRGNQKDKLLREADIFFLPSYNEGMPMSILDAMGYGLPIVSTTVGGIPKIVHDGENGYCFAAGDITGFAEAITKLLESKKLLNQVGADSFKVVKYGYSLEAHLKKICDVYDAL